MFGLCVLVVLCVCVASGCLIVRGLECMCMCWCASISVCLHLCVDVIVSHAVVVVCVFVFVSCCIHACVSMFDGLIVCVVVCVREWCDIRMLWYGDATALVCIRCKCVCAYVCGAPSVGPS